MVLLRCQSTKGSFERLEVEKQEAVLVLGSGFE